MVETGDCAQERKAIGGLLTKLRLVLSVFIRAVESKSLKLRKSLKIGKNRKKSDKIGKIGIDFLLDFFRLFGNY